MKDKNITYLGPNGLSARWDCHRTTASRIMQRYGYGGVKFGTGRTSPLRFALGDVLAVEKMGAIHIGKEGA